MTSLANQIDAMKNHSRSPELHSLPLARKDIFGVIFVYVERMQGLMPARDHGVEVVVEVP